MDINHAAGTCAGTRTDTAAPARSPSGQPPHPGLRKRGGHDIWRRDAEDWISVTNATVAKAATATATVTVTATSLAVAATTVVAATLLFPTTLSSTTLTAAAVSSTPGGERHRPERSEAGPSTLSGPLSAGL